MDRAIPTPRSSASSSDFFDTLRYGALTVNPLDLPTLNSREH
jgi:hypothetical protein